jgi:hypothetical protein
MKEQLNIEGPKIGYSVDVRTLREEVNLAVEHNEKVAFSLADFIVRTTQELSDNLECQKIEPYGILIEQGDTSQQAFLVFSGEHSSQEHEEFPLLCGEDVQKPQEEDYDDVDERRTTTFKAVYLLEQDNNRLYFAESRRDTAKPEFAEKTKVFWGGEKGTRVYHCDVYHLRTAGNQISLVSHLNDQYEEEADSGILLFGLDLNLEGEGLRDQLIDNLISSTESMYDLDSLSLLKHKVFANR